MSPQIYEPPIDPLPTKEPPSRFAFLDVPQPDEAFAVNAEYLSDPHPEKVNLGIGAYRDDSGSPWPLPVVKEAEAQLRQAESLERHEYLAIQGDEAFLSHARDLVFGFSSSKQHCLEQKATKDRIASIQTVSGAGANRTAAEFLTRYVRPPPRRVWLPEPTWVNHHTIWGMVGIERKTYPYYDFASKTFDYDSTAAILESQSEKDDIIVLHACAHNPTGADPSKEQWCQLAALIQRKGLIPVFDLAYQGFASGSPDKDAFAIRYFLSYTPQIEFCVAQSFSKNFGLYGQRAGALHLVTSSSSTEGPSPAQIGLANLSHLGRGQYSMAPRAGSEIVRTVLSSPELRERWFEDLQAMSGRIKSMRRALYDELVELGTPGNWEYILSQVWVLQLCILGTS